jgi:hypothetical protein
MSKHPITEHWYTLPTNIPLTGTYVIEWCLRNKWESLGTITPVLRSYTLTIENNGVGTVTVDGSTYTEPITYGAAKSVTIDWNGKADVTVEKLFIT